MLCGLGGNDTLDGGGGDDVLLGGPGSDTLRGGAGRDTASFEDATAPVTVDLTAGTASGEGGDTLSDVEGVIGSPQADSITGDAGANTLDGGGGDDTIMSGAPPRTGDMVYDSTRDGPKNFNVFTKPPCRTCTPRALTNNPTNDFAPAWSPNGRRIAFTSRRSGNYDLYVINANGSGVRRLTTDPGIRRIPLVVAGRHPDRLREQPHRRQLRHLDHQRRPAGEPAASDQRPGGRRAAGVVARRAADRLRFEARRRLGDLHHGARRQGLRASRRTRSRTSSRHGRPTGASSPSSTTMGCPGCTCDGSPPGSPGCWPAGRRTSRRSRPTAAR